MSSIARILACAQTQGAKRPTTTQSTCLYYDHDNEASKCDLSPQPPGGQPSGSRDGYGLGRPARPLMRVLYMQPARRFTDPANSSSAVPVAESVSRRGAIAVGRASLFDSGKKYRVPFWNATV